MSKEQDAASIFSGIEDLGFNNLGNLKLYKDKTKEKDKEAIQEKSLNKEQSLLYDKEVICPVCGNKFKVRSVKTSAPRVVKKDSDFFIRYSNVNPYFYDVWLCNSCGYGAMKKDFEVIREHQIEKINQNITSRWRGRDYPDIYDLEIAIERYKLSLLNYCVIESKSSSKAMNCLKLAWMYRLKDDSANEAIFLKQALEGFNDAYLNENFPIYGMDRYTTMYLIGELYRRTNDYERSLSWFSQVITTPSVPQKLKDIARDQKDLIKESAKSETDSISEINEENNRKKGAFKSWFKK